MQLLVSARSSAASLDSLSARERDVLPADGGGQVERGIAADLHLSLRTVESHIGHIMAKLDVEDSAEGHRRVLAVLRFLGRDAEARG